MMEIAEQVLGNAGFSRYEVASYALPGRESKHNTAYWTGVEYLGLGAAASSMMTPATWRACCAAGVFGDVAGGVSSCDAVAPSEDGRVRVAASADTVAFCDSVGRPAVELEVMDGREAVLEDAMLAFRRSAGLSAQGASEFCRVVPELAAVLETLEGEGLICRRDDGSLAPTERGWLMGNEIFGAIWDLA